MATPEAAAETKADPGIFRIDGIFSVARRGFVLVGGVIDGALKLGHSCKHKGKTYAIKSMEMRGGGSKQAVEGDSVEITLAGMKKANELPAGTLLTFRK
jgi:selenocysteine-specific translation elongation factor